jgi:hypothetical protein
LLRDNDIGPVGAEALAASPHLARLTGLGLGHNRISTQGALALARSGSLNNLERLLLEGNFLRQEARQALRERFGKRVQL